MGIRFHDVTYSYEEGCRLESAALRGIRLELEEGRFIGILGRAGSGKSTLLQHFNGILRPSSGSLHILDFHIRAGEPLPNAQLLRKRVGLVFQFPEQQLFAETVEKDLCFGPLQFGATAPQAREMAERAAESLGLERELLPLSPFRLSGGQMRKAAIASVLATNPDVFVLDEPTAALDARSREDLLGLLRQLCERDRKTIVVVTHRLEELLPYADRFIVLDRGTVTFQGTAAEIWGRPELLEETGIPVPKPLRLRQALMRDFGIPLPPNGSPADWADQIERAFARRKDES